MSSDATGEIYVILRADGNATTSVGNSSPSTIPSQSGNGGASSTGSSPAASSSKSAASKTILVVSADSLWILLGMFVLFMCPNIVSRLVSD